MKSAQDPRLVAASHGRRAECWRRVLTRASARAEPVRRCGARGVAGLRAASVACMLHTNSEL